MAFYYGSCIVLIGWLIDCVCQREEITGIDRIIRIVILHDLSMSLHLDLFPLCFLSFPSPSCPIMNSKGIIKLLESKRNNI